MDTLPDFEALRWYVCCAVAVYGWTCEAGGGGGSAVAAAGRGEGEVEDAEFLLEAASRKELRAGLWGKGDGADDVSMLESMEAFT